MVKPFLLSEHLATVISTITPGPASSEYGFHQVLKTSEKHRGNLVRIQGRGKTWDFEISISG